MTLPRPLPGLMRASFRGVPFFVPDVKSAVGRRVVAHYFPGLDVAAYDDMGLHSERISFEALYVGDDYIAQAKRLKAAFEAPGPGTLIHPWFGAINVILIEPAEISFSSEELRVVRISVEFERVVATARSSPATGPALIGAGLTLANAAMGLIDAVQGKTLSRLRSDASVRIGSAYFDLWRDVSEVRSLMPAIMPSTPAGLGKVVNSLSEGIVELAADTVALSAIAPAAGSAKAKAVLSSERGLHLTLNMAASMTKTMADAPSVADAALAAAVTGDLLARIAPLLERINPQSRIEALTIRRRATEALKDFSNALAYLFETSFSGEVSHLHRAVREMGLRLIADINETIGRLPQTTTLKLERDSDAWLIAHMLYGDDLSQVEAGYLDIIARNRLRHPASIEADNIEILSASSDLLSSLSRPGGRDRLLIEAGGLEILP